MLANVLYTEDVIQILDMLGVFRISLQGELCSKSSCTAKALQSPREKLQSLQHRVVLRREWRPPQPLRVNYSLFPGQHSAPRHFPASNGSDLGRYS